MRHDVWETGELCVERGPQQLTSASLRDYSAQGCAHVA